MQSQKLIGTGRRENGLYILDELKVLVVAAVITTATSVDLSSFHLCPSFSSFYLWYSCLGYVLSSRLRFLAFVRALENLQTCDISDCSGCKLIKFSILLFNWSIFISSSPFDLIYFDVYGSFPVSTKEGSWYYVFFIDDHTRYYWVYLIKYHSEFFEIYTTFRAFIKTQYSIVIKCFRCDLGGEYTSNNFHELLALDGTIHQTLYTDTLEQNGVVEKKHI